MYGPRSAAKIEAQGAPGAPPVPPVVFCHVPEAPAVGAAGPASAALAVAAGELNVPSGWVGLKSGPEFGLSVTASTPLEDGAAGGVSREAQANENVTPRSMEKNFMEYLATPDTGSGRENR